MSNQTIVDFTEYQGRLPSISVAGYAFDSTYLMVIALALTFIIGVQQLDVVQGGSVCIAGIMVISVGLFVQILYNSRYRLYFSSGRMR